jgi:hypothetical protein
MLICAVASLVLILAGALFMDWYRAATSGFELNRLSIDLVAVRLCGAAHVCARESVTSVRGMYPSLAAVTLWSSLGFAALVGFQAGARLLAGGALDVFTKLGYMLALMAISLAVATAYLFGPEVPDVRMVATSWSDVAIHRTWAPVTLLAGLALGFVAVYLAVARESSDPAAAYKPVTIDPTATDHRRRAPIPIPFPVPPGEQTDFMLAAPPREPTAVTRNEHLGPSGGRREQTGNLRPHPSTRPLGSAPRPISGEPPIEPSVESLEHTGVLHAAHPQMRPPAASNRDSTSTMRAARPAVQPLLAMRRDQTGSLRLHSPTQPLGSAQREPADAMHAAGPPTQPSLDPPAMFREQTGTRRVPDALQPPPTGAFREQTGTRRAPDPLQPPPTGAFREQTGTRRAPDPLQPPPTGAFREQTGARRAPDPLQPPPTGAFREQTGARRAPDAGMFREQTGTRRAPDALQPPPTGAFREQTGARRAPDAGMFREQTGARRAPEAREQTGALRAAGTPTQPSLQPPGMFREQTGTRRAPEAREQTGSLRAAGFREQTGARRVPEAREQTGSLRVPGATDPGIARTKTGPLPPIPEHLRNRLRYVALTAEVTGGGIDARREDGLSRLVLWRDVVGVVARRMPPAYDGAAFVDIVSTAGSTLRIVPWTRLTGELIDVDVATRPRAVVEHVVAQCPGVRLDRATQMFLDTGEPAQLPDLDTLRAHDERLA